MILPEPDLDAYLARIGYDGSREPNLPVLQEIHERHAQAIPFENLDVVLGRGIRLDLSSLEEKLVRDRRGGYCFEHNTLFCAMLRALGYNVTPLLARVRWQVPDDVPTPQTHMALRVDLGGRPWLADGGFGGIGLTRPLALDSLAEQGSPAEPRRLLRHGSHGFLQQVKLGDTWTDVYTFTLDEAFPIDFEVANWFTSTHPNSRFRQHLMVAGLEGDRRLSLFDREFTIRHPERAPEKHIVGSTEELLEILSSRFKLNLPAGTRFPCPGLDWG